MADPADDRAAYREAMARAEAEAVLVAEDGRETPADPSEMPGAVPVQASDQPLPVEPAPVAATPTEQPAPEAPAPPDDVATRIAELEAQIAERDARINEQVSMIGRQSSEVGEVRQTLAEMQTQLATLKAQPTAPQGPNVVITQELIDERPGVAVQAAYDQEDEATLQYAFAAWKEEAPFEASQWLFAKQLEQRDAAAAEREQALRAEINEVKAPQQQQSAQAAEQAAWSDAFAEMQAAYPDFLGVAEQLLTEIAPQFPKTAQRIADGDAADKVEGLTLLYEKFRSGDPEAVRAQLEQAAADAAAEAAAAGSGAAVVAGQTTAGQGTVVEKTDEQLEQERYLARIEGKATLERGWTGR